MNFINLINSVYVVLGNRSTKTFYDGKHLEITENGTTEERLLNAQDTIKLKPKT